MCNSYQKKKKKKEKKVMIIVIQTCNDTTPCYVSEHFRKPLRILASLFNSGRRLESYETVSMLISQRDDNGGEGRWRKKKRKKKTPKNPDHLPAKSSARPR